MKILNRIWITHKMDICLGFIIPAGFAIMGSILHDIIFLTSKEGNATVFPLGFILAIVGIILSQFIIGMVGYNGFTLVISAGETRHRYFTDLIISRLVAIITAVIAAVLFSLLESLKFRLFYSNYKIDSIDGFLRYLTNPLALCLLIIILICLSLLITSLVLRFGKAFYTGMLIALVVFSFIFSRMVGDFSFSIIDSSVSWVVAIVTLVVSAVFFFVARFIIMRQEVR